MVRSPLSCSPHRLPETVLLRSTPDRILVRAAPVGRACRCRRRADRRSDQECRSRCTLASRGVLGGYSPHAAVEDGKPAPASVARPETAGAEQLLKEFLVALLEEPSPFDEADEGDTLWSVIAAELPDELYERLTCWLMARSSGGG